jgi:ferredoxin
MRVGVDTMNFASLLVAINQAVKPAVSILEGILNLEGEGPVKRGRPRKIGVLIGTNNSFALDMIVWRMLSVHYKNMLMLKAAEEKQLIPSLEINGILLQVRNCQLTSAGNLIFGRAFCRIIYTAIHFARPVFAEPLCQLCAKCSMICSAEAIEERRDKIEFDYSKCIRCYCCIEGYPFWALHSQETVGGRLTRKLVDKFSWLFPSRRGSFRARKQ